MPENLDPAMLQTDKQDLHRFTPVGFDKNVPRPDRPTPSAERLNAPSTQVVVVNTDPAQTHVVTDRFMVGHEIQPGHSCKMEMLNDDVEFFIRRRQPQHVPRIVDGVPVTLLLQHPVEIRDEHGQPLMLRDTKLPSREAIADVEVPTPVIADTTVQPTRAKPATPARRRRAV